MVFCNLSGNEGTINEFIVTILILVDGFLQLKTTGFGKKSKESHNPYFSRWFSAILQKDMQWIVE